mmetsp:Transcript_20289/g.29900  ORF Transcript_20289/g.29900 Transcript_20289/m.29900 type:complete len:205 (+) Transcript_20289:63-677(+)
MVRSTTFSSSFLNLLLISLIFSASSLQITSVQPLLDVPTYSLATKNPENGETGMNILTYASPVSIKPDRIWALGLFKGTVAHENMKRSKEGVLQLLMPHHAKVVRLLGGTSGREVNKRVECDELGFPWFTANDGIQLELLPGCACYLRVTLVGDLIDCGSHDIAICKIDSMYIEDEDTVSAKDHLSTGLLRDLGIITEQGRVAD